MTRPRTMALLVLVSFAIAPSAGAQLTQGTAETSLEGAPEDPVELTLDGQTRSVNLTAAYAIAETVCGPGTVAELALGVAASAPVEVGIEPSTVTFPVSGPHGSDGDRYERALRVDLTAGASAEPGPGEVSIQADVPGLEPPECQPGVAPVNATASIPVQFVEDSAPAELSGEEQSDTGEEQPEQSVPQGALVAVAVLGLVGAVAGRLQRA